MRPHPCRPPTRRGTARRDPVAGLDGQGRAREHRLGLTLGTCRDQARPGRADGSGIRTPLSRTRRSPPAHDPAPGGQVAQEGRAARRARAVTGEPMARLPAQVGDRAQAPSRRGRGCRWGLEDRADAEDRVPAGRRGDDAGRRAGRQGAEGPEVRGRGGWQVRHRLARESLARSVRTVC